MTTETLNLIKEYECSGDFTYARATDMQLQTAENVLNVIIPDQYRVFLKEYGHGGIGGIEILGIGKNGALLFVSETVKYREYGLAVNLVVVENCDEWIYCINCDDGKIISWCNGFVKPAYDSFEEYLEDRFKDAAENI